MYGHNVFAIHHPGYGILGTIFRISMAAADGSANAVSKTRAQDQEASQKRVSRTRTLIYSKVMEYGLLLKRRNQQLRRKQRR
jgi:hypothetical protein